MAKIHLKDISHRGRRRQRVNRDKYRNLGSPYISTKEVVSRIQVLKPQDFREGNTDGGVSRSSDEASNARGAKGWQIVIT